MSARCRLPMLLLRLNSASLPQCPGFGLHRRLTYTLSRCPLSEDWSNAPLMPPS
ncbi:hypothetical protein GGR74_000895 [Xanthomonas arboricola]